MICLYDVDFTCPYTLDALDNDPDLCLYCEPDVSEFLEDDEK